MTAAEVTVSLTRTQVLAFRWRAQHLDAAPATVESLALLDYGVQDTGEGAVWALRNRGIQNFDPDDLFYAWTLRGAPHAYRRTDASQVAVATAPYDDADATKRIADASKPLRKAGLSVVEGLTRVAHAERDIVTKPMVKGALSGALNDVLAPEHLRYCRPCDAVHCYEQPFRLGALQAGLELEPDTSPPVLRRIPRLRPAFFGTPASAADPRFDVIRNYLRFYGPATPHVVAAFLDAPVTVIRQHWPQDTVTAEIVDAPARTGGTPHLLADDARQAADSQRDDTVRLLGAFDAWLQLRDRDTLVDDRTKAKELWRTIGRPGAVVAGGEVVGIWRPRQSGGALKLLATPWRKWSKSLRGAVDEQAALLAAHRGVTLTGVEMAG
ncbi:MAG TPA: crosslink repair DNA glycosylase YcaQ family protein [Aldersonia sp.]